MEKKLNTLADLFKMAYEEYGKRGFEDYTFTFVNCMNFSGNVARKYFSCKRPESDLYENIPEELEAVSEDIRKIADNSYDKSRALDKKADATEDEAKADLLYEASNNHYKVYNACDDAIETIESFYNAMQAMEEAKATMANCFAELKSALAEIEE